MNRKIESNTRKYEALAFSGIEGSILGLSLVADIIAESSLRDLFPFPFYALSIDPAKQHSTEWIDEDGYKKESEKILEYVKKNGLGKFRDIEKLGKKKLKEFQGQAGKIEKRMLGLSDVDLGREYEKFMNTYIRYYGIGVITFLFEHVLSEKLSVSLMSRLPGSARILQDLLQTNHVSFMVKSEAVLYKIRKARSRQLKTRLVDRYLRDFYFMRSNYYYTPKLTVRDVLAQARRAGQPKKSARGTNSMAVELSKSERALVNLLKLAGSIRDTRKNINCIGNYAISRFLEEAERRVNVPPRTAEKMFWFEYRELLRNPGNTLRHLKKRAFGTVLFDGRKIRFFESNVMREKHRAEKSSQVRGTPGSTGKARGRAKIVLTQADFRKIKRGDVLITTMTRPDYVRIMKLAGAIVTDEGGLTCHAAIVSRELGKVCVVGASRATKMFRDGDIIEVNANEGIVRKIS